MGKPYHLVVTPVGNEVVKLDADTIQVVGEKPDAWAKLQDWYWSLAKGVVVERVRDYAGRLGLEVNIANN